ncbi:hypothetical protein IEQ34_023746 [Dendrobium chrysotoxum]|uniref:Maturase K n=1 Tax=Dendrobium chrysotoxum TaxID=161865 RepID=A0AAV7FVF1_DENCH|nr:hypothetical protein IEQ34_023746 [Dendrobium chrysotoxum]
MLYFQDWISYSNEPRNRKKYWIPPLTIGREGFLSSGSSSYTKERKGFFFFFNFVRENPTKSYSLLKFPVRTSLSLIHSYLLFFFLFTLTFFTFFYVSLCLRKKGNVKKTFQIPHMSHWTCQFDVSHLVPSYPRINKFHPAFFTIFRVFFFSPNPSIQGNDSVPGTKIVVLERAIEKILEHPLGYRTFLLEQVVQKDLLFFHQIFCFFPDIRVQIPMDFLFAYWLNRIQKTLVFLRPLAHISHQRALFYNVSLADPPLTRANIQISVPHSFDLGLLHESEFPISGCEKKSKYLHRPDVR